MGFWGVKLYENDIAKDVRDEYIDSLKQGISNEETTKKMIKAWSTEDIDEDSIFWITLADTQWEYGRLLKEVKDKAIEYIENGEELEKWKENKELYKKRKEILEQIKEKLNSKMPEEKRIYKYRNYKCPWNIGDVYAYKIKNNENYKGKYIIIMKISERIFHPHNICPEVYVYNKLFDEIPKIEELNSIQYLPQFYKPTAYNGKYEQVLYRSFIAISNHYKKLVEEYIFVGNNKNYKLPQNEDKTYHSSFDFIRRFEEIQIKYYENWKGVKY